jgi:hypothetical protein
VSESAPVSRPVKTGDHVFLVDGSGYIYRAFHALPPLTRKSDGLQVGAVAGIALGDVPAFIIAELVGAWLAAAAAAILFGRRA